MKTRLSLLLALLLQGLFICVGMAAHITVTTNSASPVGTIIPERALVPLLTVNLSGEYSDVTRFDLQITGSLTNYEIGEIVVTLEDSSVGSGSINPDGSVSIATHLIFTATKTYPITVWLRAWSDLGPYQDQILSVNLVAVQGTVVAGGAFPFCSSVFTLSSSPKIGNIIFRSLPRAQVTGMYANVVHQELGAFSAEVWQSEAVTCDRITFLIEGANMSELEIVDAEGNVVAGAGYEVGLSEKFGEAWVTFTNRIVFPVGRSTYRVYGRLSPEGLVPNSMIRISARTGFDVWKCTGVTYGYRLEPWIMNVDSGWTQVSYGHVYLLVSPNGATSYVPQGGTQVLLGNLELGTYSSGEALRCSKITLCISGSGSVATNLSLYLGTNKLNSVPCVVPEYGSVEVTLDAPLTIAANAEVSLAIKADILTNAPVGSSFNVTICGEGSEFIGALTGLEPFQHVFVQFGSRLVVDWPPPEYPVADGQVSLSISKPYPWKSVLRILAPPYAQMIVEESGDMVSWTQIETVMADRNGVAIYEAFGTDPKTFYRAMKIP